MILEPQADCSAKVGFKDSNLKYTSSTLFLDLVAEKLATLPGSFTPSSQHTRTCSGGF